MNVRKFIPQSSNDDIFHSSAYAKVASGSNMGAVSRQTFQERKQIERNRSTIRPYDSALTNRPAVRPASGLRTAAPPATQRPFREPPSRGYNPYG